jgi:hypothetical protein
VLLSRLSNKRRHARFCRPPHNMCPKWLWVLKCGGFASFRRRWLRIYRPGKNTHQIYTVVILVDTNHTSEVGKGLLGDGSCRLCIIVDIKVRRVKDSDSETYGVKSTPTRFLASEGMYLVMLRCASGCGNKCGGPPHTIIGLSPPTFRLHMPCFPPLGFLKTYHVLS